MLTTNVIKTNPKCNNLQVNLKCNNTLLRVAKAYMVSISSVIRYHFNRLSDYAITVNSHLLTKPLLGADYPGGYSHTILIRNVCAAQEDHDFGAPDLERGVNFRDVSCILGSLEGSTFRISSRKMKKRK